MAFGGCVSHTPGSNYPHANASSQHPTRSHCPNGADRSHSADRP